MIALCKEESPNLFQRCCDNGQCLIKSVFIQLYFDPFKKNPFKKAPFENQSKQFKGTLDLDGLSTFFDQVKLQELLQVDEARVVIIVRLKKCP